MFTSNLSKLAHSAPQHHTLLAHQAAGWLAYVLLLLLTLFILF